MIAVPWPIARTGSWLCGRVGLPFCGVFGFPADLALLLLCCHASYPRRARSTSPLLSSFLEPAFTGSIPAIRSKILFVHLVGFHDLHDTAAIHDGDSIRQGQDRQARKRPPGWLSLHPVLDDPIMDVRSTNVRPRVGWDAINISIGLENSVR
jgi:hypothetical protein